MQLWLLPAEMPGGPAVCAGLRGGVYCFPRWALRGPSEEEPARCLQCARSPTEYNLWVAQHGGAIVLIGDGTLQFRN